MNAPAKTYLSFSFCMALLGIMMSEQSCTTYVPMDSGSYRYLYDFESSYLHPDFIVFHTAEDSSTLYFKINTAELLYIRKDPSSPFTAKVHVAWMLQNFSGSSLIVTDSSSFDLVDQADAPSQKWLVGNEVIAMPPTDNQSLEVTVTDVNKQVVSVTRISVSKASKASRQNFLFVNASTNEPLFNQVAAPGMYVSIFSPRNNMNDVRIFHSTEELRLPPPPFSSNAPEFPDLQSCSAIAPEHKGTGVMTFEAGSGLYFVTSDISRTMGSTVMVCDPHYPEIKDVAQLTWPIRYISSKTEFEEIQKNNYPKKLIDNFWMDCGGSRERARDLIRIYYNRVREANYYFTSFTEGWRTDRGMIHLVFGNPTKINRFGDSETWIYGEEGNVASLQFLFRKMDSPITGNLYVLNRDPTFKAHWERAVTAWRNGKVYNE